MAQMSVSDQRIEQELLTQINAAKSVAPREVAMALSAAGEDWRRFLPRIKQVAARLHDAQQLVFVRKKKVVAPEGLKGVYRLAAPGFEGLARD